MQEDLIKIEEKILFAAEIRDSDVAEYIEKYNKYEADYVRRVKAKYFSRKSLHGGMSEIGQWASKSTLKWTGIIFDKETLVDDEVIRASKVPPTKSFTDASCLGEEHKSSASAADPSANAPNRKPQSRKNV